MQQIAGTSLAVKTVLLLLTETIEMLSGICVENHLCLIMIPFCMHIFHGVISLASGAKDSLTVTIIRNYAAGPGIFLIHQLNFYGYPAIVQSRIVICSLNGTVQTVSRLLRWQKCPVFVRYSVVSGTAAADAILAVCLHYYQFIPTLID